MPRRQLRRWRRSNVRWALINWSMGHGAWSTCCNLHIPAYYYWLLLSWHTHTHLYIYIYLYKYNYIRVRWHGNKWGFFAPYVEQMTCARFWPDTCAGTWLESCRPSEIFFVCRHFWALLADDMRQCDISGRLWTSHVFKHLYRTRVKQKKNIIGFAAGGTKAHEMSSQLWLCLGKSD